MQAIHLFGLLIMALLTHKRNKVQEVQMDMMANEEAAAIEEATEWIGEDMTIEEETIANYEPQPDQELPFEVEELDDMADMEAPQIGIDERPSSEVQLLDSTAMNLQANWVTRVKEFGVLPTGPAAEFTFSFTNTGTEPITIAEAAPSCSCTVADYTKTPIQPGEQGWVKAVYETQGHPGFFKKFIRVEFADGSGTQLIVTGSVQ
jgi:hypothetical protein